MTANLRVLALDQALRVSTSGDTPQIVVAKAEAFYTFLAASTALTAPTPTASPLAEPKGTEPPRLDAPEVQAEVAAVIDRPSPQGDAGTTAAEPARGSETAPSPETPAASADTVPDVKDVNSAVLALNRVKGREVTVALLKKYGGSKVPEIDKSNWAALLAEAKAAVA